MSEYRVVIVEDDPMVTEVNRTYVEAAGSFRVVGTARNGQEGILMTAELLPDLVILDVYLPDLDGVQVLKEIRRRGLPVDVLMVTAAQDAETIQDVLRSGAVDYIIKPFKFERMKSTLQAYARMHGDLRAATKVSQEELDRLAPGLGAGTSGKAEEPQPAQVGGEALPKGLTDWTLRQVLLYLVNQERPLSASEVADGIGLARVTVRRYLDYLVQQRQLRVEQHYGGVGRPVYRYITR
ncbi:MAG TPA: response regulator [Symbiobacteriaceae bacterium]|jgi:two-component system response regulator DctR|nr:response regulator [Symbiobacteriaceae bacterium]